MPHCELNTNLPREKVDESFLRELSQHVAGIIDGPERAVTLQANCDQLIMREGSFDPVVTVRVRGFTSQHFTDAMREKWMTSLTPFLSEKLGITDLGRIIVSFVSMDPSYVGMRGKLASQMQLK